MNLKIRILRIIKQIRYDEADQMYHKMFEAVDLMKEHFEQLMKTITNKEYGIDDFIE